jgi:hypothetical protein
MGDMTSLTITFDGRLMTFPGFPVTVNIMATQTERRFLL